MERIVVSSILVLLTAQLAAAQSEPSSRDRSTEQAQRRTGKLVGSIHLPSGEHQIPKMINVTLSTLNGNFLERITLSDELHFVFRNVRSGDYVITVESLDYEPVEKHVEVTSYVFDEETFVTVTLGRRLPDSPTARSEAKTVPARILSVPEKAQKELDKATKEGQNNRPEKALEHLHNALQIEPNLYQAYNNLAVQYTRLGRKAEAIEALEKSIAINPDDPTTYRNLARLYLSEATYPKTLSLLKRSLELAPQSSKTLNVFGEAYLAMGQYQLALNYFERAARQDPQDSFYLGMAQCHLRLGRFEDAVREFKQFLAGEPHGPRADEVRRIIAELGKQTDPR